ncbi:MAG: hypothetical protein AB1806_09190 [Acidobacteriota bacterium]
MNHRRERGQALSEYVVVLGLTAATVIACMTLLVAPVAAAFVAFFKRLVLYFTNG